MRILVLEDHDDIRFSLELLLQWEGHDVVSFARGEEALEFLKTRKVDRILMDWRTPGVSGRAFIRAVEKICLPEDRPQIGVLSGDAHAREVAPSSGAQFFLMKPYSPEEILQGLGCSA